MLQKRSAAVASSDASGAAAEMAGSPMQPARSCRERALLRSVAGGRGLDAAARSAACTRCICAHDHQHRLCGFSAFPEPELNRFDG